MGSTRDSLPCITYFYSKRDQRPKTGFEPEEAGLPILTPISIRISTAMLWGSVSSSGSLSSGVGGITVRREDRGTYIISLSSPRRDDKYVISRFADNSVPFYPRRGTYSRIDEKTDSGFTIRWYNRNNNLVDIAFIFGIYA